jgi:probable HAF family extracellular repeat protein
MFPHASLWTNDTLVDLHQIVASLSSEGYDLNEESQVVGFYFGFNPFTFYHAFVWEDTNSNGAAENGEFSDMGTLGGVVSQAYSINEFGQVVGASTLEGYSPWHAFLVTPQGGQWDDDQWSGTPTNLFIQDLGTLGGTDSFAYAINDAGIIVGGADNPTGQHRAFVWETGAMSDLNAMIATNPPWLLTAARAINSSGHIVGDGVVSGQTHAFLLLPASNRVVITRVEYTPDSATSGVSLYWTGRGSNLGFTIETAENTTSATWHVIEPTNQWPIQSLFWSESSPLVSNSGVFRVRAASY